MVKPESYDLTPMRPAQEVTSKAEFHLITLERASHGGWFVTLDADLEFSLDDGRAVKIRKRLRLKGAQEGKRPNPNPFGRNTKRKKRRTNGE